MAICGRIYRFSRALFVPLGAIVAFSCLLVFVFVLYQPTPGPGISQRLGWQSWDAVTTTDYFQNGEQLPESAPQDSPSSGADWWNATAPEGDTSSYPTDAWVPLWPHDTGRTSSHGTLSTSQR